MRLLAEHGADPKMPNTLGITPLMVAAGLDYWEGEAPGPFTGCSETERLEAVKLALELGNDINAAADFGDFNLWRIQPLGAWLVGGFARATRLNRVDLTPDPATLEAVSAAEAGIIAHCNDDHPDALGAIAGGPAS